MKKEIEVRKLDINASPFRSECWAVIGIDGFVKAYCFSQETAISLKLILNLKG